MNIKSKFLQNKKKYDQFCQHKTNSFLKNAKKILQREEDNIVKSINDQLESSFEDMLLKTLNFTTKVYGINTNWQEISEDVILELTYSADGMNFKDRVQQHYKEYLRNHNKTVFFNSLEKIINTESKHIFNRKLRDLLEDASNYEIMGEEACGECLDHLGGGRIDIKKLFDLPPYHPNCNCFIIYYYDSDQDEEEIEVDTEQLVLSQIES